MLFLFQVETHINLNMLLTQIKDENGLLVSAEVQDLPLLPKKRPPCGPMEGGTFYKVSNICHE